ARTGAHSGRGAEADHARRRGEVKSARSARGYSMWLLSATPSVPADLIREVWLCAHLVVLDRRRGRADDDETIRRESLGALRGALGALSESEWGRETVMACYQRATDAALALDDDGLRRACGVGNDSP